MFKVEFNQIFLLLSGVIILFLIGYIIIVAVIIPKYYKVMRSRVEGVRVSKGILLDDVIQEDIDGVKESTILEGILFMIPFAKRVFGSFLEKKKKGFYLDKTPIRNYSYFGKTTDDFELSGLQDLRNLVSKSKGLISKKQLKVIENYIKNNVSHPKYGDYIINEKGEYEVTFYDLTTKDKPVYFIFGKEDKCIEVFESEYGGKTLVNNIPIKTVFKNKEELNKNLRVLTEDELGKANGLSKESLKEISKNINDLNNNKDLIDVLVKEKLKVEPQSKQNLTDLFDNTGSNKFD